MIEKLVAKLKALLDANSLLGYVFSYEREDPGITPFATITPSANENSYMTTTENRRVYAFTIRLFIERKGQTDPEDCEAAARELVDSVLNDLDSNWALSGLATQTGYSFLFMEAAPSIWAYTGSRENEYRVAEIEVKCHFSVDVNSI